MMFSHNMRSLPLRHPILGADPDPVAACLWDGCVGRCVFYWDTETVGQKIGGTHDVHKLWIDRPAPGICKTFSFDQNKGFFPSLGGGVCASDADEE